MIQLFKQLDKGVDKTSLSSNLQEIITKLEYFKALNQNPDIYRLKSSFHIGKLDINSRGIGFCEIISSKKQKDLLIEERDLHGANKGDIVLVTRSYAKSRRAKAKVIAVLKTKFNVFVAYITRDKRKIVVKNIKSDQILNVKASKKSLSQLPQGTILKIDAKTLKIMEVIGVITDPLIDEKISLCLYNKDVIFNETSISEAEAYGRSVDKAQYPNRVDLTHLPFCTIDPVSAKDFDDAIYYDHKTSTLFVAIADVSFYVNKFTSLDNDALKRGFSTYFPHKSFPMLPPNLSENICSLKPNVNRLAFVCEIKLNKTTEEVLEYKFYEAIIFSHNRFTYEQIDIALQSNQIEENAKFIYEWRKTSSKIRINRLKNGLEFDTGELIMSLDKNTNLIKCTEEFSSTSHEIIEEAMLLANKCAANKIDTGIYRTHPSPTRTSLKELKESLTLMGIEVAEEENIYTFFKNIQDIKQNIIPKNELNKMLIKTQQKATYEVEQSPHFGLGFDEYTHFTSPIRRYSDLIVHRLIKENEQKKLNYILKDIDEVVSSLNSKERDSTKIEWDFKDRKYARYLNEHEDETFEAIVIDTVRGGTAKIISGEALGARIFLDNIEEHDIYCDIQIEITGINIYNGKIYGTKIYGEVIV